MAAHSEAGTLRIKLGVVATASLLLTVASLTTLVIVVATTRADLLSVVALALAVIAFSAQLIIYIVQAGESSAANRRALELHEQLSALLSELRERSGTTQRSIERIDTRLWDALLNKARAEGQFENSEALAERVGETVARASQTSEHSSADDESRDGFPPRLPADLAAQLHAEMAAWPSKDETPQVLASLRGLSDGARRQLAIFSQDFYSNTAPGSALGPGLTRDRALLDAGLIDRVQGHHMFTLNPVGRRLGRVFTALDPAPDWAGDLIQLRDGTLAQIAENFWPRR